MPCLFRPLDGVFSDGLTDLSQDFRRRPADAVARDDDKVFPDRFENRRRFLIVWCFDQRVADECEYVSRTNEVAVFSQVPASEPVSVQNDPIRPTADSVGEDRTDRVFIVPGIEDPPLQKLPIHSGQPCA